MSDLAVMADPRRWRLLCELARSDRRVNELTDLVAEPQNLVSYHLRELRGAGLVSSRRSSYDGRDNYYRVDLDRCADVLRGAGTSLHPGLRLEVTPPVPASRPGRARRVLFLCTGNSARSQMAEALLLHHSDHTLDARSAGSAPKPLHPLAVEVMAQRGIDVAANRSKHLRTFARTRFDVVVTLCDKVREVCPEFPGGPDAVHWSTPDPAAGGTRADFEAVADDLDGRVRSLVARLSSPEGEPRHAR